MNLTRRNKGFAIVGTATETRRMLNILIKTWEGMRPDSEGPMLEVIANELEDLRGMLGQLDGLVKQGGAD